jgi:hypothetical protein
VGESDVPWIISPAPHLGDTYFTASLVEPFLKYHGGNEVAVVVPKGLRGMFKLFPDARISWMDPATQTGPYRETLGFLPGEPFYLRPAKHWTHFYFAYIGRSLPFTRMYHDLLKLPFPSFVRPQVPRESMNSARNRMRQLDFPEGRTVILFPICKSLTQLRLDFWEGVANGFRSQGFVVATNVAPNQPETCIAGTRPLSCPADELIPIAEYAGAVISARSGVCDVLATARTDLRIVYHRASAEWNPLRGISVQWDLAICGLDDHASYYRMQEEESYADFANRVVRQ